MECKSPSFCCLGVKEFGHDQAWEHQQPAMNKVCVLFRDDKMRMSKNAPSKRSHSVLLVFNLNCLHGDVSVLGCVLELHWKFNQRFEF